MPLDPSIPLQARFTPITYESPQPLNTLMGVMKIKQLGQEGELNALRKEEYERARDEEKGVRDYFKTADLSTPEGQAGLMQYGKTGLAYGKALTERDTAALTQRKLRLENDKARNEFVAQAKRDTSQNPSDANITAFKEDLMANSLFTDAEKAQMAAGADKILAMPVDQRSSFMASQGATSRDLKPTITSQTTGATNRLLTTPSFGGATTVVPGSEANVTATPAQLESNRLANARLTLDQQKFAYEKANPGMELKEDESGNLFGINKRTLEVMPVNISGGGVPAVGGGIPSARAPAMQNALTPGAAAEPTSAPQQFKGKSSPMTEAQSNAAMFGGSMAQAIKTINQVEKSGTTKAAVVPGLLTGLAQMLPFGTGEGVSNAITSSFNADPTGLIGPNAAQQKLAQAQLAFSIAYLRKTSGAAFGASELSNTIKEFFPLQGESASVIKQKSASRDRAMEGMRISTSSEGKKYIDKYQTGGGLADANANDPLGLLGGK